MKFSTNTISKFSAIILALFITVGCAGINDANFSEDTDNTPALEERDYTAGDNEKGSDPILNGEDREDIHVIRPDND
ncbi:MAG: hypothetical protein WD491_01915 [Balneolales bacterium]